MQTLQNQSDQLTSLDDLIKTIKNQPDQLTSLDDLIKASKNHQLKLQLAALKNEIMSLKNNQQIVQLAALKNKIMSLKNNQLLPLLVSLLQNQPHLHLLQNLIETIQDNEQYTNLTTILEGTSQQLADFLKSLSELQVLKNLIQALQFQPHQLTALLRLMKLLQNNQLQLLIEALLTQPPPQFLLYLIKLFQTEKTQFIELHNLIKTLQQFTAIQNVIQALQNIPQNQLATVKNLILTLQSQPKQLTILENLMLTSKTYPQQVTTMHYIIQTLEINPDQLTSLLNKIIIPSLSEEKKELLKLHIQSFSKSNNVVSILYLFIYQLYLFQYQLQIMNLSDLEQANEIVKVRLNSEILNDLDDYLIDVIYNDLSDEKKEVMKREIITKITQEVNSTDIINDDIINELYKSNPIFNIVFILYDQQQCENKPNIGELHFNHYGKLKIEMIEEMIKHYLWNETDKSDKLKKRKRGDEENVSENDDDNDDDPKKFIISIKSKRLRYCNYNIGLGDLHKYLETAVKNDELKSYYSERSRVVYHPKAYSDLSIEIYRNHFKNDDIKRDYETFDRIVDYQNRIDRTKINLDEKDTREIKQLLKNEYERIEKTVILDMKNNEVKQMKKLIRKDDNDADINKNREKYIETLKSMCEELPKYCVNRSSTNALCKVFGDSLPVYDEKDKTITIGCKIYQYPRKKVYIRDVYEEIWNELMLFILFVKLRKYKGNASENIVKINKIIKELNDSNHINNKLKEVSDDNDLNENIEIVENVLNELAEKKETNEEVDIDSCFNFLLRGNPGCGKTSFIIFLLKKIIDLGVVIDDPIPTNIYKSGINKEDKNKYLLKESKVIEINEDEGSGKTINHEIEISDSFNLDSKHSDSPIVLYIASPDHNNYDKFITTTRIMFYYYMDVFDDNEIKQWGKKCLPKSLQKSINKKKNHFNKKYGNVPRHIYYAAIYDVYYHKDYWKELYTKGIKRIVGDLGYMEFLLTYLYPRRSNDEKNSISHDLKTSFDSTLCHYIVKYSIPYKADNTSAKCYDRINEYEMEFISDDVFDYIYDCVKHKATEEDINEIKDIFKNVYKEGNNILLFKLLFEELVWYKCLFHYDNLENNLGVKLERIKEGEFVIFKELFDNDIYSTAKKEDDCEIYLLHLATLENRDMIYLLNNCFIHIMNENEGVKKCNNDFIKKCMIYLKYIMKWSNFYYIFVSSDRKTAEQSNVKSTKHHISSHLIGIEKMRMDVTNNIITKVSVKEKKIPLSGNINIHSCECQFNQYVYEKDFVIKNRKDYSIQCVVERNNNVQQQQQYLPPPQNNNIKIEQPPPPPHSNNSIYIPNSGAYTCGIKNENNNCYIISILQCLAHTIPKNNYRIANNHESKDVNNYFINLLNSLWIKDCNAALSNMVKVKKSLSSLRSIYKGSNEEDAYQFLTDLLKYLDDSLKYPFKMTIVKKKNCECNNERDNVSDMCYSLSFEVERKSINETKNESVELQQCWKGFKNVSLGKTCEKCGKMIFEKRIISEFPNILIIHLLSHDNAKTVKECNKFYFKNDNGEKKIYALIGMTKYNRITRHYIAKCKSYNDSKWYIYDDEKVLNEDDIQEKKNNEYYIKFSRYVMFYQLMEGEENMKENDSNVFVNNSSDIEEEEEVDVKKYYDFGFSCGYNNLNYDDNIKECTTEDDKKEFDKGYKDGCKYMEEL